MLAAAASPCSRPVYQTCWDQCALPSAGTISAQSPAAQTSGALVFSDSSTSTPRPVAMSESNTALRFGRTPAVSPTS